MLYRSFDTFQYNKNVDILFIAHNAFLKYPSSGTITLKSMESQIIKKVCESNQTKVPIHDSQNRLGSSITGRDLPQF